MKLKIKNLLIKSELKQEKIPSFSSDTKNNSRYIISHHVITVKNLDTKKRIKFDFWGSIMDPYIDSYEDLLQAFECFLNDAMSGAEYDSNIGEDSYFEFCDNFGYSNDDPDQRKFAKKAFKGCKKAYRDLQKVSEEDIYDFSQMVSDVVNDFPEGVEALDSEITFYCNYDEFCNNELTTEAELENIACSQCEVN